MSNIQLQFAIDESSRGEAIVDELLTKHLIACAQTVGPVRSRYWWHGSLEHADEWLFLCKTTEERLNDVVEVIRVAHPYETPEIIACTISGGFWPYLAWIGEEANGVPTR